MATNQTMTLEDLASTFQTKISNIKNCLQLRDAMEDETCCTMLLNIKSQIGELEVVMALMRAELSRQKQAVQTIKDVKEMQHVLQTRLQYTEQNLPDRLPKQEPSIPVSVNQQKPVPSVADSSHGAQLRTEAHVAPSVTNKRKPGPPTTPFIDYLMVQEFEGVPNDVKRRITYDKVNAVIDELNKAIRAKYKILYTPKSCQTEPIKKKIRAYKNQENSETKGFHFIVDDDIKNYCNLRLDNTGRTMLKILRYCDRLRELRGGGCTRYIINL